MSTLSYTSADLKRLFAFPLQDPDWKNKFVIGSLMVLGGYVLFVPFLILYGYLAQIMRRIISNDSEPHLPEWHDWGRLLVDGLKLLGAVLIYTLPLFFILLAGYLFFVAAIFGTSFLAAAAESNGEAPSTLLAFVPILISLGMFVMYALVMVLGLALGVVMPAIMGHVIATDQFGAAFRVREWWAIFRANLGGFVIAYVIILAISSAFSFGLMIVYMTIVLCCLLPLILPVVTFYMLIVYAAVFAQAYRDGVEKLQGQVAVA